MDDSGISSGRRRPEVLPLFCAPAVASILDVLGIDDSRDLVAADREREATLYARLVTQSRPSRRLSRAAEMGGLRTFAPDFCAN
jgi:hypothetical protein